MALPYIFYRSLQDSRALPFNLELEVSLNLPDGQPLLFSANGKLTPIVNNTDKALFVLQGPAITSSIGTQASTTNLNQIGNGYNSTTGPGGNQQVQQIGGFADVIPACNGLGIWKTTFVPISLNFIANASGSPTSIIVPSAPATYTLNQLVGSTVFCASTSQQARVTGNTAATSGNPMTLTIATPLGLSGATINADGLKFSWTPLGAGLVTKYSTASGTVANSGYVPSQAIADFGAGGPLTIHDVDLLNQFVYVIFN